MDEICANAHATECLLGVTALKGLRPRHLAVVHVRANILLDATPAGKVLDCLLEHRAEGLAGVTAASARVSESKNLPRDDEAQDVKYPAGKLRVQRVDVRRD
eukprot:521725-Pleurochrysis_carterae.AAC.1